MNIQEEERFQFKTYFHFDTAVRMVGHSSATKYWAASIVSFLSKRWTSFILAESVQTAHNHDHARKSNIFFFFPQCHHMSFVDFVVLPPGHGRSVTDFWGWDAHEAQLRCPDGVWVVLEEGVVPGEALNLNSTNLPRPWSPRESSPWRKIPTVEPGIEPGTSWLVVRDSDH